MVCVYIYIYIYIYIYRERERERKDLTAFTLLLNEHHYPHKMHYKWVPFKVLFMSNKRLPK
jgi:hypothetical protein